MTDLGLRPRSSTELVDAAFQLYRREPLQFIIGLGSIYVPWMVIVGALGLQNPNAVPTFSTTMIMALGGVTVYTFAGGITTVLTSDVYFGRAPDLGRAFRAVVSAFVPLVLTMLAASLAIGLGFVLLILPGLYMLARYFSIKQVVLLEGAGTSQALSRSAELSKGFKRHILNTILLVGLVTFAISIGATLLASMIPSTIVQLVISTALSAVIYPMFGITETLLYYDIRIRKEGFDIEYLAKAVDQAPLAS